MKHADVDALQRLGPLLPWLRACPLLVERRPGIFYRRAQAFAHFHEDPAGLFADIKLGGAGFERWPVGSTEQQRSLLRALEQWRRAIDAPPA